VASNNTNNASGWVGWVAFAAFMMILSGFFQAFVGLTAILKNDFFVVTNNYLITVNITTWGWVHLIMSLVLIAAGYAVMSGKVWGRTVGVVLAVLSAVANLAFVPYYPIWSLLIITVDVLVHGRELAA
jgi:hypothetical protein